ncbi:MAG: HAD family phosphatase [Candidatus Komeilibacteria bacterium]|nr:HAD family phosphatase [Candidatus Komeilibacteria bacterium]
MKAIFFDIGGVLIDTDFAQLYRNFGRRVGIAEEAVIQYHEDNWREMMVGKIDLRQFFSDLGKLSATGSATDSWESIWASEALSLRQINHELLNWIDTQKDYIIGTITNATHSRLILDNQMDLYGHFTVNVISSLDRVMKPNPEIYQLALDRAGVVPQDSVFVDDKPEYIAGARAVGMRTILFKDNESFFSDLRGLKF